MPNSKYLHLKWTESLFVAHIFHTKEAASQFSQSFGGGNSTEFRHPGRCQPRYVRIVRHLESEWFVQQPCSSRWQFFWKHVFHRQHRDAQHQSPCDTRHIRRNSESLQWRPGQECQFLFGWDFLPCTPKYLFLHYVTLHNMTTIVQKLWRNARIKLASSGKKVARNLSKKIIWNDYLDSSQCIVGLIAPRTGVRIPPPLQR